MVEMGEVFRQHGPQYRAKFGDRMLPSHRQVMRAIERCRTAALGGQVYFCEECEEIQHVYHSRRHRHCPKCQNGNAQQWLEKQWDLLLPARYFLVTFTLPGDLRAVARSHPRQGVHPPLPAARAAQRLRQSALLRLPQRWSSAAAGRPTPTVGT